ncbi:MAG: hypothetical protein AVDCRST_MAG64-4478, partial [uncultured Phycisphaerae bacterium]
AGRAYRHPSVRFEPADSETSVRVFAAVPAAEPLGSRM